MNRTPHAAILALVLSLCAATRAQDAGDATAALARLEAALRDAGAPLDRARLADEAATVRALLIARAQHDDPRLVRWLLDQAGHRLWRVSRGWGDARVLLGLPESAQREEVVASAAEAASMLHRARRLADSLLEGEARADGPPPAELRQARDSLAPMALARASILLAAASAGNERTRHAIAALDELRRAGESGGARRRVMLAVGAWAARPSDAAAREAATLLNGPDEHADLDPEPTLAWIAAAGWAGDAPEVARRVRAACESSPITRRGQVDAALVTLAHEAAARALAERAAIDPARAASLRDDAATILLALRDRTDLGLEPAARSRLAWDRLGAWARQFGAGGELPAPCRLAVALELPREGEGLDRAIGALAALLDDPAVGDDAAWELAACLEARLARPNADQDDARRVVETLLRVARRDGPRRVEAVEHAAARALALTGDARPIAVLALRAAIEHGDPGARDRRRYELARVLMEIAADEPARRVACHHEAAEIIEAIDPAHALARSAGPVHAELRARLIDELWASWRARSVTGQASEGDLARIEAMARAAGAWQGAIGAAASAARFSVDVARVALERGEAPDAAELQRAIDALEPGSEAHQRGVIALARTLIDAGDEARAFALARTIAGDRAPPGDPAAADRWWHAWTLVLEILSRQNSDGSRGQAIRGTARRLRAVDEHLGGEPWRTRIVRVVTEAGG